MSAATFNPATAGQILMERTIPGSDWRQQTEANKEKWARHARDVFGDISDELRKAKEEITRLRLHPSATHPAMHDPMLVQRFRFRGYTFDELNKIVTDHEKARSAPVAVEVEPVEEFVYHAHCQAFGKSGEVFHWDGLVCSSRRIDDDETFRETRENLRKTMDPVPLKITISSLTFLHALRSGEAGKEDLHA